MSPKEAKKKPKRSKKQHVKESHSCYNCNSMFSSMNLLKKHLSSCEKLLLGVNVTNRKVKEQICCEQCSKRFKFKSSYKCHLLMEHSKASSSVPCKHCSVRCPNKLVLKQHIQKVHNREMFQCEHCSKVFVRKAHVLRHWAQRGCSGQPVTLHVCEICNASFTRKDNLMVHLRQQHILRDGFFCKHCNYHTRNFSKLIIHTQDKHMPKPLEFECDHCGKTTSSRTTMAKHLEIHGAKKFSCDVCGYNTHTVEVMRRHILTHVKEKPFKCHCGRSFIQKMQLDRHQKNHTSFSCDLCQKMFSSKKRLLSHQLKHIDSNKQLVCPYQNCEVSKAGFTDAASLKEHIKSHDVKPFMCEVCSKAYESEMHLRRHMSIHTLDRPRRCMYCVTARAYIRGEQLLKHVRRSHPDLFKNHLMHARSVLGVGHRSARVSKSELSAVLNILDAEANRIIESCGDGELLYGGVQFVEQGQHLEYSIEDTTESPLMSEEELSECLNKLLSQLVDTKMLECFGWPNEDVDLVLEKLIEQCDSKPADRTRWSRVQRLRENAKQLFLYVVEDKNIGRMLNTLTIDQVIKNILEKVTDIETENKVIPYDEL